MQQQDPEGQPAGDASTPAADPARPAAVATLPAKGRGRPPPSRRKPVRRFLLKHVLPPLAVRGYRSLAGSWDQTIENGAILEALIRDRRQVVGVFLHARLILLLDYFSRPECGRWMLMASPSRDGEFLTRLGAGLGFGISRGSSGRGGARALVEMIKAQRADRALNAALAIDGSRGPRGVAQAGVFTIAQKTGALILPVAASTADCWIWRKSWDRMVVPRPRASIRIGIGEPLAAPTALDAAGIEALRLSLQQTLLRMHAALDSTTGFRDPEPLCEAPARSTM